MLKTKTLISKRLGLQLRSQYRVYIPTCNYKILLARRNPQEVYYNIFIIPPYKNITGSIQFYIYYRIYIYYCYYFHFAAVPFLASGRHVSAVHIIRRRASRGVPQSASSRKRFPAVFRIAAAV